MTVRLSPEAKLDFENQIDFVALDSPRAAEILAGRLHVSMSHLSEHPRLGREGRTAGTRELVVPKTPFVLVYRMLDQAVEIVRVLHGRQDWPPK